MTTNKTYEQRLDEAIKSFAMEVLLDPSSSAADVQAAKATLVKPDPLQIIKDHLEKNPNGSRLAVEMLALFRKYGVGSSLQQPKYEPEQPDE